MFIVFIFGFCSDCVLFLFLLYSENFQGIFCPRLIHVSILFFKPDVPGKPGTPEIADVTSTSLTIKWKPPDTDGGSPITNYVVEQSERFSPRWNKISSDNLTECEFTIKNLPEGQTYQFRVSAQNKAGVGKPSAATEPKGVASK